MIEEMTEVSSFILIRSHMLRKLATHYRRTFVGLWIQKMSHTTMYGDFIYG